ncbi:MAG: phospho-N-acetylmuramoyl-pentapeptide-transferase [Solirubrobacterales bacterium]
MNNDQIMLAVKALIISFGVAVLLGPLVIPMLARLKAGQVIRDDGPARHLGKAGTPTMGGIMIIAAVIVASIWVAGRNREIVLCLGGMVAFGIIGFLDDYIKVVLKRSLGLRAREKLIMQLFFGLLFGIALVFGLSRGTEILIPFTQITLDLSYYVYLPFIILVFMGTTNGVNLTDGLDGLAAGVTFVVAIGFSLIAIMTSQGPVLIFAAALAGGCLGFLVFNRHPAKVFMGDTGSMALGGAVAAMAAMLKAEIALLLLGGVYVIETLSVIIQIASFQTTGRRVFLMAPLHHHFELAGWKEKEVVRLFWLAAAAFVLVGLLGYRNIG